MTFFTKALGTVAALAFSAGAALSEMPLAHHFRQNDQTFRHPARLPAKRLQVCRTLGRTREGTGRRGSRCVIPAVPATEDS